MRVLTARLSILALVLLSFTAWLRTAAAAEVTNVSVTFNGKPAQLSAEQAGRAAERCIELLKSCSFMKAKPSAGDTSSEATNMATAQKGDHVRVVFPSARKVEVPAEKMTLQLREMVISLPLSAGGIWARSDEGVRYFAKFQYSAMKDLEKALE